MKSYMNDRLCFIKKSLNNPSDFISATSQFCSASSHTVIYSASLENHAFHSRFYQHSVCDVSTLGPVLRERNKQSCYELGADSGQSTTLNSEEAKCKGE